ncbi:FadR/GntR family transcriptional regulator [Frigidibacter mobilis]|uniref:GntR domain protein n=1 Tax=Frigidibacter mobilis TaxID=1335048 RepID=A0A159Z0V1_9RHOB|nr:FCD domain-containing protein [Frigidibacter mobilis]AMY68521.1 GntR domain protein [Frigidibacter mobilis]
MTEAKRPAPEPFARLEAQPAYLRLAEAIEREIVSGRIAPGDPVGTEATLCEQFGVNRSTVREGIRLLEQSGLLRRDQSRRLYASLPRYHNLTTRMSRALVLHQTTFRELWEAAQSLETASVEAAARRATDEDIAALTDNLERSRACLADADKTIQLDSEFHTLIARAGHNRVLELAREPASLLFAPTLRVIWQKVDAAPQRNIEAHAHIIAALARHDEAEARLWMQRHIKDWRRGFEKSGRGLDDPVERSFIEHESGLRSGGRA